MKKKHILICCIFFLGVGISQAQYTDLLNFNNTSTPFGANPQGDLTISGKVLFGMTAYGGANDSGCIFSIDTNGSRYKDMLDFSGTNGAKPYGSLTLIGNKLFGMTSQGGANHEGCIFSIDTNGGGYKDLFDFSNTIAAEPYGSLTSSEGKLYGMTMGNLHHYATIFTIDTSGANFKNLFQFNGTNGDAPYGSLTLSGEVLFGMTFYGGSSGDGNVFSIDTNGNNFKDLFDFNNSLNGRFPCGSLTLSGNKLFGMVSQGGLDDNGFIFSMDTNGNGFKDFLDFDGSNGNDPFGSLTLSGKNLYGMTSTGGISGRGVIFSIDTNGNGYTSLYKFASDNVGENPWGDLILGGSKLYGMTEYGGIYGNGVVFKLDTTSSALSVDELYASEGTIKTYPNPSSGVFTMQIMNNIQEIKNIEVYNLIGEKIFNKQFSTFNSQLSIDLSNQPDGVYLYRVISESGVLLGKGKVIIQH